jgi:voltage-gated sodium channel
VTTARARVAAFVEHARFQRFIIWVIVLNAIVLALQTYPFITDRYGSLVGWLDSIALGIFVIELALKLFAYRWDFFKNPWNVFDFVIVAIALVPASGPFAVLRALRVLRVLRLISRVESMRRVVGALLAAVPGMVSIMALAGLIIFVAGVMGTAMFGDASPTYFGDLGTSLFSLFQTMTGEAWPEIADDVMRETPVAWIFFVIYILISSFAVLNLFIAVVVSAMEEQLRADLMAEEHTHAEEMAATNQRILDELAAVRAELSALRNDMKVSGTGH